MLIECKECKQQISDTAYICPKCGFVYKKIMFEKSERLWQLGSMMFGLLAGVMYFLSKQSPDQEIFSTLTILVTAFSVMFLAVGWITSSFVLKSE